MEATFMDNRLSLPFRALRLALGLTATLAGLDKFFNMLADWGSYVSPMVAAGRRGVLIASLAAFGMLQVTAPTALAQVPQDRKAEASAAVTLRQDMRKLWTDHVIWTRAYVVAAVADQPDAQPAATRLLKNQEDIGAAVGVYYGKTAGDRLTALLKDHILIAVDLIKHAKSGDKASFAQTSTTWAKNGDEIADFLSQANPNWPRESLRQMMRMHLSTTTDVVVARLTKNWDADVRSFDVVYDHILAMADALSAGIIKQFPHKFASS
jgi:hypothetical protein